MSLNSDDPPLLKMDFDYLPDVVFLRIFDYLSFTDRFRVSRVSQSFNRISRVVNARIKSLDLDDPIFDELDEDQFEVVLRLCQHNLRDIKFCNFERGGYLAAKFSEFTCPQLVDLDLNQVPITGDEFARIVTNHPNLKSLKWWANNEYATNLFDDIPTLFHVEFPPVALTHLETLHIQCLNDATLERLIDRCPNLKTLRMTLDRASSEEIWDRFFRSVPRLESLRLDFYHCPILMENLEWFWRLPLTSLWIIYQRGLEEFMVTDDFINKLIERFTNIEQFNLWLTQASDDSVVALAHLERLRVVKLCVTNTDFTDEVIREFSACRHLEELSVYATYISDQTFSDLFGNCPNLRKLNVHGVFDDDDNLLNAETAGMLLLELANKPHRPSITIEFYSSSYQNALEMKLVWESIQVQNAMQHLRQNHGIEVNICFPFVPPPDEEEEDMEQDDTEANDGDDHAMDEDGEEESDAVA